MPQGFKLTLISVGVAPFGAAQRKGWQAFSWIGAGKRQRSGFFESQKSTRELSLSHFGG
jgi:hypothetical protein